jgi:5-enolpyruvylshikimate-3-phosphate synthase
MAMSAAVAGLCGPHPVSVAGFDTVASSWPGFVQQFKVLAQG